MLYPQHSGAKDTTGDESLFQSPRIALLNQKHWAYIQKRYHMSPRELQVAQLVCQGYRNGEIAKALKIRDGTVKTHLRNIYRRVRAKNKISMLLKLIDSATKFSDKSGITSPVPIVDAEKPAKKPPTSARVHEKEK